MLPHFYRSDGYNQVFRKLGYHHMIQTAFVEHGEPAGFYPIWRSADQPPFSREDIRFLNAIIPHVAHGLRAARLLEQAAEQPDESFVPLSALGFGIVILSPHGRVIATDDVAKSFFARISRFESAMNAAAAEIRLNDAFVYITRILKRIFFDNSDREPTIPAPVMRVYSHASGIVLRLRGVLAQGEGSNYLTVIVEQGELAEHRLGRLRYRWGLSPRETDILVAMSDGKKPAEIAAAMNLQRDTLKSYLRRLTDKLDIANMSELRSFARTNFRASSL
jgi:DNA-binding CsgD family transcriptional regulator